MGQCEIFQFLKENEGQMFISKDIKTALGITTHYSLSRLRRYPPEGFNFSKEALRIDRKNRGKTGYFRFKTYIYWYIPTEQ